MRERHFLRGEWVLTTAIMLYLPLVAAETVRLVRPGLANVDVKVLTKG